MEKNLQQILVILEFILENIDADLIKSKCENLQIIVVTIHQGKTEFSSDFGLSPIRVQRVKKVRKDFLLVIFYLFY